MLYPFDVVDTLSNKESLYISKNVYKYVIASIVLFVYLNNSYKTNIFSIEKNKSSELNFYQFVIICHLINT